MILMVLPLEGMIQLMMIAMRAKQQRSVQQRVAAAPWSCLGPRVSDRP